MLTHPAATWLLPVLEVALPKYIDITDRRFGRLVVMALHSKSSRSPFWLCQCDCGNQIIVNGAQLRRGHTRSCKCLHRETHSKHGQHRTGAYNSWINMRQRCTNPNNPGYHWWGGRGITICERWQIFENFFADMGPKPPGYTIERINNDGNYEPSNCIWIPNSDQWKNTRQPHSLDRR